MALGFIKKVFSFGKDKAESDQKADDVNASFEEVLQEAELAVEPEPQPEEVAAEAPAAEEPVLAPNDEPVV